MSWSSVHLSEDLIATQVPRLFPHQRTDIHSQSFLPGISERALRCFVQLNEVSVEIVRADQLRIVLVGFAVIIVRDRETMRGTHPPTLLAQKLLLTQWRSSPELTLLSLAARSHWRKSGASTGWSIARPLPR